MAKGAATEQDLGKIHAGLTQLFSRILKGYDTKMSLAEKVLEAADPEDELISTLLAVDIEPSPAMLSAISRFLKDNDISMDSEQLDKLSAQEERLKNKQRNRPDLKSITQLKVVDNG